MVSKVIRANPLPVSDFSDQQTCEYCQFSAKRVKLEIAWFEDGHSVIRCADANACDERTGHADDDEEDA